MEPTGGYYVAWVIYLAAVVVAQLLLRRSLRPVKGQQLKILLQLFLFALLITPVPLEPGQSYWLPAFMAALMESLNLGVDALWPRLWPIFFTMLLLLCLLAGWRAYRLRRQSFR